MQETDNRVFTVPELARLYKRHPRTIRRWIKKGKLPAIQVGKFGRYLIKGEDLKCLNYKPENRED